MAIISATNNKVTRVCTMCGAVIEHQMNDLEVGFQHPFHEDYVNQDIIELPKCACGATEVWNRVADEVEESSQCGFAFVHLKMVNKIHDHLCGRNKFKSPKVKQRYEAEGPERKPKHVGDFGDIEAHLPKYLKKLKVQKAGGAWTEPQPPAHPDRGNPKRPSEHKP